MSEAQPDPSATPLPVSTFAGPVAELIAQRMLLPPDRPGVLAMLDHYEILRVLGGGGMGIVLLARDPKTSREVAIKMVKSELVTNQQVVHRFLKEAGHLKRLRHTNIVPVWDISDRPEGPYFVMPFFEKGSLAGRIKPDSPLNTETILDIAAQVAEGLAFAHRSGIIHRDLKPANILIGNDGQACLGDFGLARTLFNDTIVEVESRHWEGTAPYMSPAVAAGNAEDTRCDIYSFGALLYEMLTGQCPYQGRGTKEILDQILAGPPRPILSLNPAADRGLAAVAETAMARELRDRYAEMRDVLGDLQRIKQGKAPVTASKGRPFWRTSHAIEVTACIVVVALLGWVFLRSQSGPSKPVASAPALATNAVPTQPVVAKPPPVPPATNTFPPLAQTGLQVTTLAGRPGQGGYGDGPGDEAQFHLPNNLAVDRAGNVFVADTANNVIRKITPEGVVSTLAGQTGNHGSTDGSGGEARFWAPFGIAVDGAGNILVADTANNTIRKITPSGVVNTLAGLAGHPGSTDGAGSKARFRNPWSVAVDSHGNVIVADMSNDTVRRITPTGDVTTLAGQAGMSGSTDGFAIDARFNDPFAVTVDGEDNIYISDSGNNTIRKLTPAGTVVTLAGLASYAGNTDGSAQGARFWNPQGLAVDQTGNIYVADNGNNAVRKITSMGVVTTLPELAATNRTNSVALNSPGGVAVDSAGNIYVADTNNHCVRKLAVSR
jgi:serine/threonine protein kinase/sugar lactone lactonase YvrE